MHDSYLSLITIIKVPLNITFQAGLKGAQILPFCIRQQFSAFARYGDLRILAPASSSSPLPPFLCSLVLGPQLGL